MGRGYVTIPGRSSPDGEACRLPRLEPAGDVGGVAKAHVLERGRRQAGRVPRRAEHHDDLVVIGDLRDPVGARRIEPPFEDVALDDARAGRLALPRALCGGTDVD